MTTNIVEQMLVELGLDASKFAAQADKAEKKNQALEKSLDKTEKASKQAGKANEELAKKYHSSIEQIAKMGQELAKVTKELTKFFGAIIGSTGLFKLANDAAHANMEVSKLSGQLGMATASITDWQNAAGAFGGSAQGMTASLTGIKQAMNGLVMFGDASMLPYFNALGVSVVDNAGKVRKLDDVMLDLADSFQKMPKEQAYTIGKKMGFDDGTINALISGRKELQEILDIQKRMYHSDEKAIARSRELTKQQAILSAHWQSMKQLVGDALTPILLTLIKVVNSFFDFLQRHEKVVKAVFQTAAIVIGMLLIPTLLSAGRALLGFVAPFAPAIAAVTALAGAFLLLYDDYDTWAKGGKSLFDWGAFSTAIKGIKISVDTLCTAFGNMVKAVKNNAIPALKSYAEAVGILAHDDYNGSDKQIEQAEQAKQVEPVEQAKQVEQAKKAEQTKQVKQAKQTKKVPGTFSDIVIGAIADATGQKKEDVADFVGESMYKLFHGGKDYFEQNSTQKPVKANTSRGSVAKGSVTESKGSFAQELNAAMDRYGIKDAKARASFLSNVDNETGGGKKLTENPNFSLKRWRELAGNQKNIRNWLNAHKDNQEAAFKALSQQDKVNIMYNKMIGNKYADDPWKFRGRGGMQLTGRANYQAYADYSGRQDIMSNPDLIATDPRLAADSAAWFFMKRSKAGQQAQAGDIAGARKTVNGGTIGMNNYMRLYGQYLQGKGVLSNNNIQENALKAQSMIAYGQRMQTAPVTHNDNRKYVNVNIPNMNVNTSSNTVSGNTVAAMKEVQNYTFNQLGVSMT